MIRRWLKTVEALSDRYLVLAALVTVTAIVSFAYPIVGAVALAVVLGLGLYALEPVTRWHRGRTLRLHLGPITSVAFSADGRTVVCGAGPRGAVVAYDVTTRAMLRIAAEQPPAGAQSVTSPDGTLRAVAGARRSVRVLDASTGAVRRTLRGHTRRVNCVGFSPDGRLLASGSDDGAVKIWKV